MLHPTNTGPSSRSGFTLLELLVVVTIIVVLLALLAPALEKTMYQAELTVCGANQKGIGNSVTSYAMDFKRSYPRRPGLDDYSWQITELYNPAEPAYDFRPLLEDYMSIEIFSDPAAGKPYLSAGRVPASSYVHANYDMWFGIQYRLPQDAIQKTTGEAVVRDKGMFRIGDRLTFTRFGEYREFNLLAGDYETFYEYAGQYLLASHTDKNPPSMSMVKYQDATYSFSYWLGTGLDARVPKRGPMDRNFCYADGSVVRLSDLEFADKRLVKVWERNDNLYDGYRKFIPPSN